ncbi:hypothetical protein G6F35_018653 [Rhizopus arrhizus]|nr:hypothetical protein G6F35_018653 [Rhizopus arrhizus]
MHRSSRSGTSKKPLKGQVVQGEIHAGIRLTPAPRDHPRSGDGRGGGLRDIAFQPGRSGHHHGGRRRHA